MKRLHIAYSEFIEPWLNGLSEQQFSSLVKELLLVELCENKLKLPHSKPLGKGLFELRERTFGLRVY